MAEGLNRWTLIGNLGQDPALRYTQSGTAVMQLRMATSENYLDQQKQRQEKTEWHTVIVWGRRAEGLQKILGKGDRIGVEGKLQTRTWEDKQGIKRYTTEVVAINVILCGSSKGAPQGQANQPPQNPDAPPDNVPGDASFAPGDDIPF